MKSPGLRISYIVSGNPEVALSMQLVQTNMPQDSLACGATAVLTSVAVLPDDSFLHFGRDYRHIDFYWAILIHHFVC
jgi:hypothetical protein